VTEGDKKQLRFLRATIRAALTGRADLQKYLEIIGGGGTGKSTFMNLLAALVGEENVISTDLKNLENNRFEGASIYGKKLVLITDSERYGGEVSKLKSLTGQDPIRCEQKNKQQHASFVFGGFVVMAANEPIQSTDYTSGLSRRRITLHFTRKVPEAEKTYWKERGGLLEAMRRELPGLLNWVLQLSDDEVTKIIDDGGAITAESNLKAAMATNPIARWLDENCVSATNVIAYVGKKKIEKDENGNPRYQDAYGKLYPNKARVMKCSF
jgi:putative DNA primase/helicase